MGKRRRAKGLLRRKTVRQKIRDEYIRDSTVTVVLVGAETWQRKHVDWEIGSSIRHTEASPRCGLLGIMLPTYPRSAPSEYDPYTIPPRLHDNLGNGFATIHNWSESPVEVAKWIHAAFERRNRINPNNARISYEENRSGPRWQP